MRVISILSSMLTIVQTTVCGGKCAISFDKEIYNRYGILLHIAGVDITKLLLNSLVC